MDAVPAVSHGGGAELPVGAVFAGEEGVGACPQLRFALGMPDRLGARSVEHEAPEALQLASVAGVQ